jgi:hypothetical protein
MVPADDGSAPPPPARERDAATSVAPESSAAVTTSSIKDVADTSSSRYLDFPGIGIIDLDTIELPSNDQEILEAVTERVFADPSILYAITSDPPVPRQVEGVGSLAPLPRRRRPRGFSKSGDAAGHDSSGGSRSGGKRGVDADDP